MTNRKDKETSVHKARRGKGEARSASRARQLYGCKTAYHINGCGVYGLERFAELVRQLNNRIYGVVWGTPMLILILSVGVYMTVRTGFFQITAARLIHRKTLGKLFRPSAKREKDNASLSQLQAISTALAATIGTGNIAGVAAAITLGGPGAIFWMWVSAFFGMMTAFAENTLGVYYRGKNVGGEWAGGAMYYLERGLAGRRFLGRLGKPLAVLFAVFCLLASFGIGNMTQSNTVAEVMKTSFVSACGISVPPTVTGAAVATVSGVVILGGAKRVGRVTERLVPFMAAAYMLGTSLIFVLNIKTAPAVFSAIFKGAFGLNAALGGAAGAMIRQAVSVGFKRGVFSNEAGLGSSVIVNSVSDVREPVEQGMWGVFEVFFDTIVVCTLTAFSVLSTGVIDLTTGAAKNGLTGAALVTSAFSVTLHDAAGIFVALSTVFFAVATILGWSFYGTKCMEYLFGGRAVWLYKLFFVGFTFVGAVMDLTLVWEISDTLNGLMALPNLIGVIALSGEVLRITENYLNRTVRGKDYLMPLLSGIPEIQREQERRLADDL